VLKDAGYTVQINPEKARKGSFVVVINDKTVIELLAMPRPFTKLRETDVEEVVKAAI
jgi:hypothetical protein